MLDFMSAILFFAVCYLCFSFLFLSSCGLVEHYLNIIRIPFWLMCSNFKCISSSFLMIVLGIYFTFLTHYSLLVLCYSSSSEIQNLYLLLCSFTLPHGEPYQILFLLQHETQFRKLKRRQKVCVLYFCLLYSLFSPDIPKILILFLTFCLEIFTCPFTVDLLMTHFFCLFQFPFI